VIDERARHVERQQAFYEQGEHRHLRPRESDFYADKLARRLARASRMRADDRVLEVGAGFGRFSFSLLKHCRELIALDLSPRALATLEANRESRGISRDRLRSVACDFYALEAARVGAPFDLVVGFFILHHLPDLRDALRRASALLEPGGRIAFLEPNRRNPLFLAQVLGCPDMHWREEKGLYRLGRRRLVEACEAAGLCEVRIDTFGFFPPAVLNRLPFTRRLEERLERPPWLRSFLPMRLVTGTRPERTP